MHYEGTDVHKIAHNINKVPYVKNLQKYTLWRTDSIFRPYLKYRLKLHKTQQTKLSMNYIKESGSVVFVLKKYSVCKKITRINEIVSFFLSRIKITIVII